MPMSYQVSMKSEKIQTTPSIYATEFDIVSATVSCKIDENAA